MISFPRHYFMGLYFLQDQDCNNSLLEDLERYHMQLMDQVMIKDLRDHLMDVDLEGPLAGSNLFESFILIYPIWILQSH